MTRSSATLFLAPLLVMAQGGHRLTIEDLLAAPAGRGGAVLSPDGKSLAVIDRSQIALVPTGGGEPVPITSIPGAKSEVNWSHDSKKLAFAGEGSIWVVPATGGVPKRLTGGAPGPGDPRGASDYAPRWNPGGKWILYQSGRRGQDELYVVSEDGGEPHFLAAAEIYEGRDRLAPAAPDHGDAVSVDRFDPNPQWSPDGTRISYTERSGKFFSGKLKLLAFDQSAGRAKGLPVELYTAKNDRGGAWAINTAAWSPDGKALAIVLQETGWDKVYLLPANGGSPRQLTRGESEDESPVYSPDGKWLAIVSNRGKAEERHIWLVPVDGSEPRPLTKSVAGVEANPQWSADGKQIFFTRGTPFHAASLYVAMTSGSAAARPFATAPAGKFESLGLPEPEAVHFPSNDGLSIGGILYRPLGYKSGARYPAVIWAHGGPEGQDMLTFAPWPLFLAQEGYVVLQPNFRGSTGYGERFRNLNVEDSGGGEIDDVGAAVKYLVDQGLADPKRVAIGGGSHGGTVVANAVVELPGVFAAAMDLYGVVDRALFLQYTNRNSRIRWETKMGGTPEEKPEVYRKANVLADVARIQTPLLILHGEEDPQVPPQESAQFAAALRQAGKTYLYFTYPHEGHGFTGREHRLDAWRRQLAFLREYLQPAGEKSSAAQP